TRCDPTVRVRRAAVDPPCGVLGTAAPTDCGTDGQDLRPRLIWASRGDPLCLQCGISWCQTFPLVGVEPKDRHRLLRGERQGVKTGQGFLSALAARQPKRRHKERDRSGLYQ